MKLGTNTPQGFLLRDKRLSLCNNKLGQTRETIIKNLTPPYEEKAQASLNKIMKQQSELVLRYKATLSRYFPSVK